MLELGFGEDADVQLFRLTFMALFGLVWEDIGLYVVSLLQHVGRARAVEIKAK